MNRNRWVWFTVGIILIGILAGITRTNLIFARANPGGNDFLPRWGATRAFLLEGISPYSDQTALRIQMFALGRPARFNEDEFAMLYPLYAVIVYAPFALVGDYSMARALWMTTLEISAVLLTLLSIRLVRWKPTLYNFGLLILFSIVSYHSVRSFINGNVVTLLALLIITMFWAIQRRWDMLAGGLLVLITIKPQLAILLIAGVFIWAISHQRWTLIRWTIFWGLGLSIMGMLIIPDWLVQNLSQVIRYRYYAPAGTVQAAMRELWPILGVWPGRVLTLVLSLWLLIEWRAMWGKPFEHFLSVMCLTLALGQWIGIQTDPGNFVILFLPLVWVFAQIQIRWGNLGSISIGACIMILLVGLWVLFLSTVEMREQALQSPIMFFPLPLVVIMGFLVVRISEIQSRRTAPV
jgi:Glycosyltransferase family 87